MSDAEGHKWFATEVGAGSNVKTSQFSEISQNTMTGLLDRSTPVVPPEQQDTTMTFGVWNTRYMYGHGPTSHQVSTGQMEAVIATIRKLSTQQGPMPPNMYIAVCREAPGIEFGTEVNVVDGWHVVMGYY